jgi:hypothetical protein
MKKILLSIFACMLFAGYASAQTGNNQISVGPQVEFFLGDYGNAYNTGFGGNIKGLLGVGTSGQISLSSGYTSFSGKGSLYSNQTFSVIPIMAGYRWNSKSGFYINPQVGVTINSSHFSGSAASLGTYSQTQFGAQLDVGYATNNFDFSVHYLSEGDVFSLFGIKVAYNIPLGDKK